MPAHRQLRNACRIAVIASPQNLWQAAAKARKHKSRRPDVETWWLRRESAINRLSDAILADEWKPGGYRFFEIHEPKCRRIAAAPFEDRVVHHALCHVMQPLLQRRFIARSFSCQAGKGTSAARQVCRSLTNRHRYVLKCDVAKFFPNIDHAILSQKLAAEIRCPAAMRLIALLLSSFQTGAEIPAPLFPGDDLVEVAGRPRGVPIGNLTSQLWGNFYLDGLDHRIVDGQGHGAYLRYTDDFLLFGDDKRRLWELHALVVAQLEQLRLKLAIPKSRLMATKEGVPFCGMRFLPGLAPRILGDTKRRFEKRRHRMHRQGKPGHEMTASVYGWYQFSREANSEGLLKAYSNWPMNGKQRRGGPDAQKPDFAKKISTPEG